MEPHGFVVGLYESEEAVQAALAKLQDAGFSVKQISVVSKLNESEEKSVTRPAEAGALIGQPQPQATGKAKVSDANVSSILMASLKSAGVLKENAQRYEDAVSAGKFLLVAEGSSPEVVKAEQALHDSLNKEAVAHVDKAASSASN